MQSIKVLLVALVASASIGISTQRGGHKDDPDKKKLICYFTNWAFNREGPSKFDPSKIDPTLCTHIIYSFAVLDENSLTIQSSTPELDITQGHYAQVTALRCHGVKVLIGIGGWGDSAGDKYSRMVTNSSTRATFVSSVVDFLLHYDFDGIDLDWEYPSCPQVDCAAGLDSDKANFVYLLQDLRAAFKPHGFLLSAAVSSARWIVPEAYDIPAVSENLDWIGLMSYDYHGAWDGVTGHGAPFRGEPPNVVDSVNFWLSQGAAPNKLVLGIPLYGKTFTLSDTNENAVGVPATNGSPGQYTQVQGFLAYFEFCTGWTYKNVKDIDPYAYKADQWVSYDDENIIKQKADFVKEQGLGGAMIWALDLDDFDGHFCGKGRYPLLSALRSAF